MDLERLEKNLCDNIYEAQLKLGYDRRPMSLNYMLGSLCKLLGVSCSAEEMEKNLAEFSGFVSPRLGNITFRPIKEGFCITVPESGTAYVDSHNEGGAFITGLVSAVRDHKDADAVLELFRAASKNVCIETHDNEEFMYLAYFPDGVPDEYYYCISIEEEIDGSSHASYHRFIREDYEELGFD